MRAHWPSQIFMATLLALGAPAMAEPLLPDMTVDMSVIFEDNENLRLHYFLDNLEEDYPGRTLLKFGSSLPNLGPGQFILRSTAQDTPGLEPAQQEIRQSDSSPSTFTPIPTWFYDNVTRHMECFDWVSYRVREILPGDGVGEILRTGQKPSVRLVSTQVYNEEIVEPSNERITLTHSIRRMGVSVGWTDIYTNDLELQWVDVTGLKQGEYWLELVVDYGNFILEANENNNVARAKVMLNHPSQPNFETHRADTQNFGLFDLTEILRVIQLYNGSQFECAENTEDGYILGGSDHQCQRHSSDFEEPFWTITLSELLRSIQLFNLREYEPCGTSEDGFCPSA